MLYRHTQRGVLVVSVCLAAAAFNALFRVARDQDADGRRPLAGGRG